MKFDFKVIARSFPAIALIIAFVCFLVGLGNLGAVFLLVAVASFALVLFANR
jgi:hypothetical protein